MGFPGSSAVNNPPAVQKMLEFIPCVRKIPLKEGVATHSSILDGKIPWTEEHGWLQSMGLQRIRHS